MYNAYAGEDEVRTGYRVLFTVGVLSIIGGLLFASLSSSLGAREIADGFVAVASISAVSGIAAIAAGILVRRRNRSGVLLGIVVGALGVAFAAFDVVSAVRIGAPITTIAAPFVLLGLNVAIVRALFMAEPYVRAEDR